MSKQYKLLKWYPGIRTNIEEGAIFKEFNEKSYITEDYNVPYIVPRWEIEDNPKFWEEVEEKDYEVLSVKGLSSGWIYSKVDNNKFKTSRKSGDYFVRPTAKDVQIHSVRRLSDGEVFTVGDRVKTIDENSFYTIKKIVADDEWEGGIWFARDGVSTKHAITIIEKVKESLFTTEDGVDIYEGDSFYGVLSDLSIITDTAPTVFNYFKTFKSLFKAEKYVEERTRRYSKADIEEALDKCQERWFQEAWRIKPQEFKSYLYGNRS